jgi:hypothetical protein
LRDNFLFSSFTFLISSCYLLVIFSTQHKHYRFQVYEHCIFKGNKHYRSRYCPHLNELQRLQVFLQLLLLLIVCACAAIGNFIVVSVNKIYFVTAISSSGSIAKQPSAVHRIDSVAVAQSSAHSAAQTLSSNATTSGLLPSMAVWRGLSPSLQAGG